MKYKYEYACLKYYKNINSTDFLYLGILLHNQTTDEHFFKSIVDYKLLEKFDSEADIEFIKSFLDGLEANVKHIECFSMEIIKIHTDKLRYDGLTPWTVEHNTEYVTKVLTDTLKISNEVFMNLINKEYKKTQGERSNE